MNGAQETAQALPAHCLSPSTPQPGSAQPLFCFGLVLIGQSGPGGSVDATYSLAGAPSAAPSFACHLHSDGHKTAR